MKLAIITTADRFGLLGQCKATEAFETGCLREKLSAAVVIDACKIPITLPPDTTHVLVLGPRASEIVFPGRDLDKFRGQLTTYHEHFAMATYHPTDAQDQTSGEDDDSFQDSSDEKDSARTRPSNYFFWIRRDVEKLLYQTYVIHPPLKYIAAPNLEKFIAYVNKYLAESADPVVYLDIECRREDHVINCVGLAFGNDSPVFVIPFYFWNNQRAYGDLYKIIALLSRCLTRATVVVHNALFDLFILSRYYRCLVGHKIYDTMLCQHRCFPEAEKSLGHTISYWTYLPFHKDLAVENPRNPNQQGQMWEYNARDVYAMREVHKAQIAYLAAAGKGLQASVQQANDSIYPYLLAMLRALHVDDMALMQAQLDHTKRARAMKRICRVLSGEPMFNPGSSDQCVEYFHRKLHYESVAKTDGGKEKMDQKSLYKLRLKYPNPLLDAVIAYRVVAKAGSMLDFVDYTPPHYENIRPQ